MSSDLLKELIESINLNSILTEDLQVIGEILEETVCNNSSVFSMLLNKNVGISVTDIKEADTIDDFVPVLGKGISAEINFEAGINGTTMLYFNNLLALNFANGVMGAEETTDEAAELGQLQISAFSELINQFASKMTTGLTSLLETKIGALSPTVKQQDGKTISVSSSLADKKVILVVYNIDFENLKDINLYQVISVDLANDIVEKFKEAKIPNYNMLKGYTDQNSANENNENVENPAYSNKPVTIQPIQFSSFDNSPVATNDSKNLDLLMDIKLKLTVELGRTELPIKKVLELARGSVIELDKIAGEPVELFANGKLIAHGEVVVIEDNFGLRITSILSPDHRLKNL
ncbi:MAG: flagellar motor switch protein FliN [Candidatus Gastranaerophilales bacterium]|nr:flagellar motor switch protein FliN [Candidatus Gastranaerophilales bacterium]